MTRPPDPTATDSGWQAAYEAAARATDLDGLHDLIVRYGLGILDRSVPYLVVAARRRASNEGRAAARDRARQAAAQSEAGPSRDWLTGMDDELRDLLDDLAGMDDRHVLVLWEQAKGRSDEEIRAVWVERGLDPLDVTINAIRARRKRARRQLRERHVLRQSRD